MFKLKKHIYLLLAIASILTVIILRETVFGPNSAELYLSHVKNRLYEEVDIADREVFLFKKQMKEDLDVSFSHLLKKNKYPLFVFKNKELVFWSDHTFHLEYFDVAGFYSERCVETRNSVFIAKKSYLQLDNQDYEIVALIPIRQKYQVDNQFLSPSLNQDIFTGNKVRITTDRYGNNNDIFNKFNNVYLFSIDFPQDFTYYSDKQWILLVLIIVSVILIALQLKRYLQALLRRKMTLRATLLLGLGLIGIRAFMLFFEIPNAYIEYTIFKSKIFASSVLNPSLGDLLLNVICLLIIILFFYGNYPRIIRYKKITKLPEFWKGIISILAVIISFFAARGVYDLLDVVYTNSSISLDITLGIDFPLVKIVCLVLIILISACYFFIAHICSKLLIKLAINLYDIPLRFVLGSLVFYLFTLFTGKEDMVLFNINSIYILFISFLNLPLSLKRSDYSTYIYLFMCAVIVSLMGAYAIYKFEEERVIADKNNYTDYLKVENDLLGEYLLNEMSKKIQSDPSIQNKIKSSTKESVDWITKKLKRVYLKRYFDKYEIDILLFDDQGNPYNYRKKYSMEVNIGNQEKYKTQYSNIYFVNSLANNTKRYVVFLPILQNDVTLGHIVLKLNLRKIIPNSIHPNLFVANTIGNQNTQDYSYAIYSDGKLLFSSGDYRYGVLFGDKIMQKSGLLKETFKQDGYHHLITPKIGDYGAATQYIVVSSPIYPTNSILTNFSFLFLVLVFVLLILISSYNFYLRGKEDAYTAKLNFNTKVQIYLNFAFFLPLIIVSIIIVSILNSSNIEETKSYYLEKAQSVANDLTSHVQEFYTQNSDLATLSGMISEISNISQSDINLFDQNGKLIMPSQDFIYENELMNDVVNPTAYAQITEQKQSYVMMNESIGSFDYHSAYVSIKSLENGRVLGIVGIPFFGSKQRYERQVIDVLSKIIQAFAFIMVGLLGVSYISARSLTAPLRLIRQKIKRVNFHEEENEAIDYVSDDEIGLLVNEYNSMLLKLADSKEALSQREKESAWREMAKQVAHEIKNPLTPMKLSIQQLERVLDSDNPRIKKTIGTLLSEIDTLSEIATSFSNFAEMPTPKEEVLDITKVLRQVAHLHNQDSKLKVNVQIPERRFDVVGDEQLLGRVFNNIVINGVQAVPSHRKPTIDIKLIEQTEKITVSISDNGGGIPEDIQRKVFVPNFTTKSSGSGIGLAISRRAIEHLGGKIWFDTEPGLGTTFFIELPLHHSEISETEGEVIA